MTDALQKSTDSQIILDTANALLLHKTVTKAAAGLQLDRSTIYKRMEQYPQIMEIVNKTKEHAMSMLVSAVDKAAEIILDEMDNRQNKYEAAKEILDRVGIGAKTGQQTNIQVNVSPIYGGKSVE